MENKNNTKKKQSIMRKNIYKSLTMIIEHSKAYIPITFFIKILQGLTPIFFVIILQQTINIIQNNSGTSKLLFKYIIILMVVRAINGIFLLMYDKYNNRFCMEFTKEIDIKMMNKAVRLSLKDFEDSDTYDVINRAQNQKGESIIKYIHLLFDIVQQSVSIISMGYILIRFKWQIVLIISLVPVVRSVVTFFHNKKTYEMRIERTPLERQKWYINFLVMTGKAYKEIKILGIGSFLLKQYKNIQDSIILQEREKYTKITNINIFLEILEWTFTGGIYLYIFGIGFCGKILLGDITAYIECINNIKGSLIAIFTNSNSIIEQSMYIGLLFDYLDLIEHTDNNEEKVRINAIESIELNNVSFRYNKDEYVIKDVSFKIKAGESVAFVGENGSGKTTLLKLILGFYNDYDGTILINNINMDRIDMESYQKNIGIVFQDYIKYEASIRENIGFGNMCQIKNDNLLVNLLKKVHLSHKIEGKSGLETIIGNWFGDQQFSIGEWQRLAIARALIRDADVYVWDESDASLDVLCQKDMAELFLQAKENRIGIYISHKINRLNELVDIIITIKKGEIIEIGEHNDLIKKNGYYCKLYYESVKNV